MLWPVDVATVARRARGENFPIASLLFPRHLRPHLRAVYGYCRLVDILGDEVEADRLAAPDELQGGGEAAGLARPDELGGEVEACYTGTPTWPVLVQLQPTIRQFDLQREPFL